MPLEALLADDSSSKMQDRVLCPPSRVKPRETAHQINILAVQFLLPILEYGILH